jgi:DNA-binding CsgD family transcriptional regulator
LDATLEDRFRLVSELISFLGDPNVSFNELAKYLTLKTFNGCNAKAVYLMNLTSDAHLELIASFGQSEEQTKGWRRISLEENIPGTDAIKEDRLVWLSDKEEWEEAYPELSKYPGDHTMHTLVNAPLYTRSSPCGVLGVMCDKTTKPTTENIAFIDIIAGLVSLHLAKFYSKQQSLEDRGAYLTKRQITILEMISQQMTNMQIARELGYSESTIRRETMRIYELLQASGRREAVVIARKLNLIK